MDAVLQYTNDIWEVLKAAKGEVWPAWFQAVGSVGAIIAAVWVARHQTNVTRSIAKEELARQSEAVSALAIIHALNIRNEIRRIRKIIADDEANLGVLEKSGAGAALVNLLFTSTGIDSYLLSNASALAREARLSFPQVIALKEMYNARMRELYEGMEKAKDTDLPAVNDASHTLLGAIETLLDEMRKAAGATNDAAVLQIRNEQ